ncbi:MAG: glutaredoxin family protein [Planctomycetaceae bacterium]|nr:glutaredoxin family protein [Planctomycetaceae bacterium]
MADESDPFHRFTGWLGTILLTIASLMAILIFADRMDMQMFSMPDVWVASRELHVFACVVLIVMAGVLLMHKPGDAGVPSAPVFQSVRVYSRNNCHLCDEAVALLLEFRERLPIIDIVDVDEHADLQEEFGEVVPVVEIDDVVRFRGRIERGLLERLIEAAVEAKNHNTKVPNDQ